MRKTILAAALALVAFAPVTARAQTDASKKTGGEEGGALEGSAEVAPGDGTPDAPAATGNATTHTVEKGDTLWDLSQKFLGSPWYWPKVWSYNPEIANPHWIYPGNQVRFVGSGEEVPTQVEVGQGPEDVGPGEMLEEDKVQVAGPIGYRPKGAVSIRSVGFVTAKELDEAGKIVASFSQAEYLTFGDNAYVEFKKKGDVKVGDRFVLYRSEGLLSHPTTGDDVGYMTRFLGTAKVSRINDKDKYITLIIQDVWDEITRGALLGPLNESLTRVVSPRANDKEMTASIVSSERTYSTNFAEHEVVIIDKGSDQGVQPGNTFTVVRQQEGLVFDTVVKPDVRDESMPKEDVGTCMVIDTKSKASTCLMVRSLREIVPGDRLEMRVGGRAVAAR